MITATGLYAIKMMRCIFPLCGDDAGRPLVAGLLQRFEEPGLGREVTRVFVGESGEARGGLSHIWRPGMEQDSMSNIWNSNCIM